jgi:hypothetical protein
MHIYIFFHWNYIKNLPKKDNSYNNKKWLKGDNIVWCPDLLGVHYADKYYKLDDILLPVIQGNNWSESRPMKFDCTVTDIKGALATILTQKIICFGNW